MTMPDPVLYRLPAVDPSVYSPAPGAYAAEVERVRDRQTFKGPTEETMHGPVQVSIVVKSKKIVNVKTFINPNSDGRSPFLQQRAVPILKQETVKAHSAQSMPCRVQPSSATRLFSRSSPPSRRRKRQKR
jgi:hypothetical protein